MRRRLLKDIEGLVLGLSVFFMLFLTAVSFLRTTYFTAADFLSESPRYRWDSPFWNLAFLCAAAFVLCVRGRFRARRGEAFSRNFVKVLAELSVLFMVAVSLVWVQVSHTYPESDQGAVSWIAYLASQDDFLFFEPGKYMQIYPNQLGLTAILEALYRITGGENWKAFMYLTALANGAVAGFLYRITDRIFHSGAADCFVLLLTVSCAPLILYTAYIYGITLGLAFALAAFDALLSYLEHRKFALAVLSALLIGSSVLIKNNYSIFLVALVLLLLYRALQEKRPRHLAAAAALVAVTFILSSALTALYEQRSGEELGGGMPKTLWMAMGLQEGERAEGWYNEFNYATFLETGCDAEESDRLAREAIAESLEKFRSDPAYALRFFYKKIVSQWNEPTYESQWANQFHSGEFSRIVQSIYEGKLFYVLLEYMNLYQLLVFAATLISLLGYAGKRRKKWRARTEEASGAQAGQLYFPLVILGGFAFHLVWEAKSSYILPYFVCMLPGAAVGMAALAERLARCGRPCEEK